MYSGYGCSSARNWFTSCCSSGVPICARMTNAAFRISSNCVSVTSSPPRGCSDYQCPYLHRLRSLNISAAWKRSCRIHFLVVGKFVEIARPSVDQSIRQTGPVLCFTRLRFAFLRWYKRGLGDSRRIAAPYGNVGAILGIVLRNTCDFHFFSSFRSIPSGCLTARCTT